MPCSFSFISFVMCSGGDERYIWAQNYTLHIIRGWSTKTPCADWFHFKKGKQSIQRWRYSDFNIQSCHDWLCNKTFNDIFFHSQGLISRTKDFDDTYELIRSKLASVRHRLMAADGPQPDILAKKSQSDQFKVSLIPSQSRARARVGRNVCWSTRLAVSCRSL